VPASGTLMKVVKNQ